MVDDKLFGERYEKIIRELDLLYSGAYDKDDADRMAALTLLARANISSLLANSEMRAKSLKRNIEFTRAEIYCELKDSSEKKLTQDALAALVNKDDRLTPLYKELFESERDSKYYSGLTGVLADAHISFRQYSKRD